MLARLKTLKITPVNAYKSPLLLTLIGCKQGDFLSSIAVKPLTLGGGYKATPKLCLYTEIC